MTHPLLEITEPTSRENRNTVLCDLRLVRKSWFTVDSIAASQLQDPQIEGLKVCVKVWMFSRVHVVFLCILQCPPPPVSR